MEQLLIIEDDRGLNQGLCKALKADNRQIFSCQDLKTAREQLLCGSVSLILLDINLPDGSGLDLLQEIKEKTPDIPVILLTANDTDMDIVDGLERGADDYITKPFSLSVLRARVNTQLRKKITIQKNTSIHIDHFCFDFGTMTFCVRDAKVELSKTEQKLLHLLVENRGQTMTRGDLVDRIWTNGAEYVDENALSVTVKRLRDKLGAQEYIKTVYGIGYSWVKKDEYTSSQLGESIDASTLIAIVAFLVLVILTGYLIIYNIFQISVTGDIRFYGLLKTIGVTPRQLRRIIRQQALFLCVVGIPIGLLLGYGVGASLTPVVMARTTLGVGVSAVSTSPLIFFASALFALITVLLSCSRPGKIASKVSPVEATKYTEIVRSKKKHRTTRGAKVYQMAFANLGRNKRKTVLVVISLSLSVVLLNVLVTFTGGFDMEKYLAKQTCADFIVSSTDYFRYNSSGSFISQEQIEQIEANTSSSLSGCGYKLTGYEPYGWMSEEHWLQDMIHYTSEENAKALLEQQNRRDDLVSQSALIEGLDESLFEKLTVIEGDISPLFQEDTNAIAVVVNTDDYGNVRNLDFYPPVGSIQTITYIDEGYYIDSRTGNLCDENTPSEYIQFQISASHDVEYTVCAYVTVPYSMSFRYYTTGYNFVLPIEKLNNDSQHESIPMFYLFDTPDDKAEASAENYLTDLTANDLSALMYESKATLRAEFEGFQNMFLLLGGLLCAIIGLVGVLNFFNAIMTGILSRKREFAVLQAVGMTKKQLKAMLVYEGLFYALSSALSALVLSFVMNPLIGDLLENMFWFFSAKFTIVPVVIAIPIFALLGWLIPYVMYDHAAKYSIVEQLRDNQ